MSGAGAEALVVRPYAEADLPDLEAALVDMQVWERTLSDTRRPPEEAMPAYVPWLMRQLAEKFGVLLVAVAEGRFGGFVAAWVEEADYIPDTADSNRYGLISDLQVVPAMRGRRVAQTLLAAAERHLAAQGVTRLRITALAANASALAAYRRYGFADYEVTLEKRLGA